MMKICDACGSRTIDHERIGGAKVCSECVNTVRQILEERRQSGETVNPIHAAKARFRELHGTPGVLQIRDVPGPLRQSLEQSAALTRSSIREIVIRALYNYLPEL